MKNSGLLDWSLMFGKKEKKKIVVYLAHSSGDSEAQEHGTPSAEGLLATS